MKQGARLDQEMVPTGADDFQDPVTKWLNTIPPDWEAAQAHGQANLVVRNTKLNFDDESSYCKCCMLPYPDPDPEISKGSEESNFYPICADT